MTFFSLFFIIGSTLSFEGTEHFLDDIVLKWQDRSATKKPFEAAAARVFASFSALP